MDELLADSIGGEVVVVDCRWLLLVIVGCIIGALEVAGVVGKLLVGVHL